MRIITKKRKEEMDEMEKVHENLRFPRCCQLPLSVAAGGKDRDERWIQPHFGTRHLRYGMYLHMDTCLKLTKRTMALR